MTDREKESLNGNVDSVRLFAYKIFTIDTTYINPDTLKKDQHKISENLFIDTVQVLISVTRFSEEGFYSEIDSIIIDTVFSHWLHPGEKKRDSLKLANTLAGFGNTGSIEPVKINEEDIGTNEAIIQLAADLQPKSFSPDSIFPEFYRHKEYLYRKTLKDKKINSNAPERIKSYVPPQTVKASYLPDAIITYNSDRNGVKIELYTYRKRYVLDSVFFFNGGFSKRLRLPLSRYGTSIPLWKNPNDSLQFDSINNLIIDKNIHYYYSQLDSCHNWTEAIKYYDGPKRGKPVWLRREITYYKEKP